MKENDENPLGIENKEYTIEEFGATIRNKFGGDENVSNTIYSGNVSCCISYLFL